MAFTLNPFTGKLDSTGMTLAEAGAYLKLNQSTPQTVTGTPEFPSLSLSTTHSHRGPFDVLLMPTVVGDPTIDSALTFNYGSGGTYWNGGYSYQFRVYAYDGSTYSAVPAVFSDADNGASNNNYTISFSWLAVSGAVSYRVVATQDDWYGAYGDYYFDTTSLSVDIDGGYDNVSTNSYTYDSAPIPANPSGVDLYVDSASGDITSAGGMTLGNNFYLNKTADDGTTAFKIKSYANVVGGTQPFAIYNSQDQLLLRLTSATGNETYPSVSVNYYGNYRESSVVNYGGDFFFNSLSSTASKSTGGVRALMIDTGSPGSTAWGTLHFITADKTLSYNSALKTSSLGTVINAGWGGTAFSAVPEAWLEINRCTETGSPTTGLKIKYDASNYFSTTVGSTGLTTLQGAGSAAGFAFKDVNTTPPATIQHLDSAGNVIGWFKKTSSNGEEISIGTTDRPTAFAKFRNIVDPAYSSGNALYILGPDYGGGGRIYFGANNSSGVLSTLYAMDFSNVSNWTGVPKRLFQSTGTDAAYAILGGTVSVFGNTGDGIVYVHGAYDFISPPRNASGQTSSVAFKSYASDNQTYNRNNAFIWETHYDSGLMETVQHTTWNNNSVAIANLDPYARLGLNATTKKTQLTTQAGFDSSTFTAATSDVLTVAVGPTLRKYMRVQVANSGGALPTGLSAGTTYYVGSISGLTCKLATSVANVDAGTWVDITATGSGTHTIYLTVRGTTTANASTTITGTSTKFTTQLGIGDRISLSSAPATYATITAIASDTSLTVDTALGNGSTQYIYFKRALFDARLQDGTQAVLVDDTGRTNFNYPARLKGYTVATLPTGIQGDMAFVTDALAPAWGVAVVGGGAVVTKVFYNGTNWIAD